MKKMTLVAGGVTVAIAVGIGLYFVIRRIGACLEILRDYDERDEYGLDGSGGYA